MNFRNILLFFLGLSLILETTFFSFPLVIIFSLFLFILFPSVGILITIFIVGLLLDSVKAGILGATPLFLFLYFLLLTVYQKVFNFKDSLTVILFIFLATVVYAYIFTYSVNIFSYVLFFALLIFPIRYFKNFFSFS